MKKTLIEVSGLCAFGSIFATANLFVDAEIQPKWLCLWMGFGIWCLVSAAGLLAGIAWSHSRAGWLAMTVVLIGAFQSAHTATILGSATSGATGASFSDNFIVQWYAAAGPASMKISVSDDGSIEITGGENIISGSEAYTPDMFK